LADEYRDKGLLVIAPHRQNVEKDVVVQFCKEQEVNYTVLSTGDVKGDTGNGIPRSFLFDHTGKCVFTGHPGQADDAIEEAIKKAPDYILGPGEWVELKREAAAIVARKNFGKTMATVRKLQDEGEGAQQEEAARMFERLDRCASREWELAMALKETRPAQAMEAITAFSKKWKGDQYGDEASDMLKELKKDKSFKEAIVADTLLAKLEATLGEAKPCKFGEPLDLAGCDDCRKDNKKILQAVAALGGKILKKHPDTPAAKAVQDILRSVGLD
jgi:hypothetical protein